MTINSAPINSYTINGRKASATPPTSELICRFIQSVGQGATGNICTFIQDVEYNAQGGGQITSFLQEVRAYAPSQNICSFKQIVQTPAQASAYYTYLQRNGFYPYLVINGFTIPDNQIYDVITITRQENNASQLTFTLIPPKGVQSQDGYIGADVQVYVSTYYSPEPFIIYSGVVSTPTVNLIEGKVTYTCSDLRQDQIEEQLVSVAPYLGYYSEAVFGKAPDLYTEVTNRLSTVPYALDFDASGNYTISALLAKPVPDFVLQDSDVYRNGYPNPTIERAPRANFTNQIDITATYQYQRGYNRSVVYTLDADPTYKGVCDFLANSYSVPTREMVQSAITSVGWPVDGDITYTEILPANFYTCRDPKSGAPYKIGWATTQTTYNVSAETDGNGDIIKDDKGNAIMTALPVKGIDMTKVLCFGATWRAYTRYSQNLKETYTISVQAPQSINQYGTLEKTDAVGVTSAFDTSTGWESTKGSITLPYTLHTAGPDQYFNFDTQLKDFIEAELVAINKANTDIIKSHRDNHVTFTTPLFPELDLAHTVKLDCTRIKAQGKVFSITHTLKVNGGASTAVNLALSLIQGGTTPSNLNVPPTRTTYEPPAGAIGERVFTSHWGEEPQTSWTGYIGNKYILTPIAIPVGTGISIGAPSANYSKTTYSEQVIIESPPIEDDRRGDRETTGAATYIVAIQNDLLFTDFLEKM